MSEAKENPLNTVFSPGENCLFEDITGCHKLCQLDLSIWHMICLRNLFISQFFLSNVVNPRQVGEPKIPFGHDSCPVKWVI